MTGLYLLKFQQGIDCQVFSAWKNLRTGHYKTKHMKAISYPFIAIALAIATASLPDVYSLVMQDPTIYRWFLCGMGAYLLCAHFLVASRESLIRVFTHELTHAIVGTMFFRKITSFNATRTSGVIMHSKGFFGDIFISLAPYCLPIYTFAFLLLRLMSAESSLFIFDMIIGFTLALHINCFAIETRPRQTDIKSTGYIRSIMFILTAWALNLSIVMLSVTDNVWYAVTKLTDIYKDTAIDLWHMLI